MSLTVYLSRPIEQESITKIMIWDAEGHYRELTRAEWVTAFPDFTLEDDYRSYEDVHSQNITHNLGKIASEAGFYDVLWRAKENGIKTASQLIEPLRQGIDLLKSDPARFKPFSASNGWGTYEQFIPWLIELLNACEEYPDAEVSASR